MDRSERNDAWLAVEARFGVAVRAGNAAGGFLPPDPGLPVGTDTIPQIRHIVVLMMENHSFDNYFGMLGRGDGLAVDADGLSTAANLTRDGPSSAGPPASRPCRHQVCRAAGLGAGP